MTSPKNHLSALALTSFEAVRLRLRIGLGFVRLAFLQLLIALVRAGISLGRRISAPDTPPPPTNDPCIPGR